MPPTITLRISLAQYAMPDRSMYVVPLASFDLLSWQKSGAPRTKRPTEVSGYLSRGMLSSSCSRFSAPAALSEL